MESIAELGMLNVEEAVKCNLIATIKANNQVYF